MENHLRLQLLKNWGAPWRSRFARAPDSHAKKWFALQLDDAGVDDFQNYVDADRTQGSDFANKKYWVYAAADALERDPEQLPRIKCLAAAGCHNSEIAELLGVDEVVVSQWRYFQFDIEGLVGDYNALERYVFAQQEQSGHPMLAMKMRTASVAGPACAKVLVTLETIDTPLDGTQLPFIEGDRVFRAAAECQTVRQALFETLGGIGARDQFFPDVTDIEAKEREIGIAVEHLRASIFALR